MSNLNKLKSYSITENNWGDVWQQLREDCIFLSDWGSERLKQGLLKSAKGIILENHYTCIDHRNLYCNYYSKKFRESSPYTKRLHFFLIPDIEISDILLYPESFKDHYLGYSVIRPVKERCLGRSVFDPKKLMHINNENFFCLRTPFKTHIGGRNFTVNGFPYMSQDTDVTVCAHSALWGVCRYLSERYSYYGELYPFDLITLTDPQGGRAFPYRGMTYKDYSKILSDFGAYPVILWLKKEYSDMDYDQAEFKNLCTYVESGFPILASFPGHVVSVIGHTIDYNKPIKTDKNGFVDSSSFIKQFIVIDDNFFPYQLLGENDDHTNYARQYPFDINSFITGVCPLPEKVFLQADEARKRAYRYFTALKKELDNLSREPWMLRLFLTSNASFKRRKLEKCFVYGFDELSYLVAQIKMPHFIWVMEASPLSLYKQGECNAEIVLDATSNIFEDTALYMRIGNKFYFNGKEKFYDKCPKRFSQFTHNLGEK